ncbi:transposase [Streptomyces spectabilis]|uniref:Transposase DDE domain-containing protein n=1 Tax=Streptomyces spectabilis TaxID=68270 RepID=A0A5P2X360_STRST|nr:transposase [Streptomyces spectabilis]MCI3899956.1 transposase [Streptomyces spectabilis]QEV57595.1 hypothetical protein CP982_01740 [Streptomyces spectabilis]
MRRCRYRNQSKGHFQHVLTAVATNIECLNGLPPTDGEPSPRPPTALPELPQPAQDPPVHLLVNPRQLQGPRQGQAETPANLILKPSVVAL